MGVYCKQKEMDKVLKEAVANGAKVSFHKGHLHLLLPNGKRLTASGSPSDGHIAALNLARDIRKYG